MNKLDRLAEVLKEFLNECGYNDYALYVLGLGLGAPTLIRALFV